MRIKIKIPLTVVEVGEGMKITGWSLSMFGRYLSKRIGRKEQEYAVQRGYNLHLLVYELTKKRWIRWRLLSNPNPHRSAQMHTADPAAPEQQKKKEKERKRSGVG